MTKPALLTLVVLAVSVVPVAAMAQHNTAASYTEDRINQLQQAIGELSRRVQELQRQNQQLQQQLERVQAGYEQRLERLEKGTPAKPPPARKPAAKQ